MSALPVRLKGEGSPCGKRHPSQRLHSPLPSNNRTTARSPPLDILYLLDTNSEKLHGECSSLNIIARALLVTIFSNYTCTKNEKGNYAYPTWHLIRELGKQSPAAAMWHGASDPVQVKKIYSPTTTYENQNPIILFCLFYLELQNKISHDDVLLKVVMLLF